MSDKLAKRRGKELLQMVKASRHEAVARHLAGGAVDLEVCDESGWTPLIWAANEGSSAMVRMLLAAGADVDHQDHTGYTCLHQAVYRHRLGLLDVLLEFGVDPNQRSGGMQTPLHIACAHESVAMVLRLLDAGANPNLLDSKGRTALELDESGLVRGAVVSREVQAQLGEVFSPSADSGVAMARQRGVAL